MSNAGIPLRVIQEISGHRNLEQLQRYLEVTDEQVLGAAASLAMLSPVASNGVELDTDKKPKMAEWLKTSKYEHGRKNLR